jgi:hypothetical protein
MTLANVRAITPILKISFFIFLESLGLNTKPWPRLPTNWLGDPNILLLLLLVCKFLKENLRENQKNTVITLWFFSQLSNLPNFLTLNSNFPIFQSQINSQI